MAAEDITTSQMGFLIRHSSGVICAPLSPARASAWALEQMVSSNQDPRATAYTVSVDAADPSVTTGISARDRALACRALAREPRTDSAGVSDVAEENGIRSPGHVFPLRSREGGVRVRRGHTEAATEFCRLTGKAPVGVIAEIVDDGVEVEGRAERMDTGMLRGEECVKFARRYGLRVVTIADLVEYVEATEGKVANGDR